MCINAFAGYGELFNAVTRKFRRVVRVSLYKYMMYNTQWSEYGYSYGYAEPKLTTYVHTYQAINTGCAYISRAAK